MVSHVGNLRKLLGKDKVVDEESIIRLYSREPSGYSSRSLPQALILAENVHDVSKLLSYAYRRDLKIYPQGSTTSLTGSAVPLDDGVILSLERMNRIKRISVVDSLALVEAGVRIDELNLELAGMGYQFPVDPASSAVATVGGAVNSGAGGMRGAKYGTMRDWVLGLRVVLPDEEGSVLWLGCTTLKCRQGYDLARLIVGSEGTLAVTVEAALRVTPLPERVVTVLAFFPRLEDLAGAAVEVKERGLQPYIMEFMDDYTTEAAVGFVKPGFKAGGNMLLVSMDVNREAADRIAGMLRGIVESHGAGLVYTAMSMREAEEKGLFSIRRSLFATQNYLARVKMGIRNPMIYIEDIAVPPSRLVEAVREIRMLEERYGLPTFMGGHISDGNLHPAVGFDPSDKETASRVEEWFYDIVRIAIKLGGTVSSEHGIGLMKKEALKMELEAHGSLKALSLMRKIKRVFDPKGILNPGKIV